MKIKREQIGGPYGDLSCSYTVSWDKEHPTVREFIDATLKLYANERGRFILIGPHFTPLCPEGYLYCKGVLLMEISEDMSNRKMDYIWASGDCFVINYYIHLKEDK